MSALVIIVSLILGCGQHVTRTVAAKSTTALEQVAAKPVTAPARPTPLVYVAPQAEGVVGSSKVKRPAQHKAATSASPVSPAKRPAGVNQRPPEAPAASDGRSPLVKKRDQKRHRKERRWVPERVRWMPYGGGAPAY